MHLAKSLYISLLSSFYYGEKLYHMPFIFCIFMSLACKWIAIDIHLVPSEHI